MVSNFWYPRFSPIHLSKDYRQVAYVSHARNKKLWLVDNSHAKFHEKFKNRVWGSIWTKEPPLINANQLISAN